MGFEPGEAAVRGGDQMVEVAGEAVGGDLVLHEAPDALGRVGLVGGVLGQPEDLGPRVGRRSPQ